MLRLVDAPRDLLTIVAAGALSAAMPATMPAGSSPLSRLTGTTALRPPPTGAACRFLPWEAGGTKKLYATCSKVGAFAGTPAAARASYAWEWDLVVGANGRRTGHERGAIALDFGRRGVLELATLGRRAPAGATMKTTGTWTLRRGTKSFAGERGHGTYTFAGARLTLEGMVS